MACVRAPYTSLTVTRLPALGAGFALSDSTHFVPVTRARSRDVWPWTDRSCDPCLSVADDEDDA